MFVKLFDIMLKLGKEHAAEYVLCSEYFANPTMKKKKINTNLESPLHQKKRTYNQILFQSQWSYVKIHLNCHFLPLDAKIYSIHIILNLKNIFFY